jgi:hypothetical protein
MGLVDDITVGGEDSPGASAASRHGTRGRRRSPLAAPARCPDADEALIGSGYGSSGTK